jgi:hypothetical protein
VAQSPGWLARTMTGIRLQKQRYRQADLILERRLQANARKRSSKRKPAKKVLVSAADSAAVIAFDKENIFRPFYSVCLLRDLDSPLIFSHSVLAQTNDNGVLGPIIEQMMDNVGYKPEQLLADSGFLSLQDLQFCHDIGITLYGPCQENDYSNKRCKKRQSNQHTALPKSAFQWLQAEQTYQCPQGHHLRFVQEQRQMRCDYEITLSVYRCPPEHCQACPQQSDCTRTPHKGRTVSRMEHEELLDDLRQRMQATEAKRLYKLRSQSVELDYADIKEHRAIRMLHSRGPQRVGAEIGSVILAHNLLAVANYERSRPRDGPKRDQLPQTLCVA